MLSGTPHNYETIDLLQSRQERPAIFRKNARFDEVPLLLIDGEAYVQSNAILLHLATKMGAMNVRERRAQIIEWLMWEQSRLGFSLPNLRFERKFQKDTNPAILSWLENRLRDDLNVLNAHLLNSDGYATGNDLTIADCSLAGYLYWLADTKLEIKDWPAIEAWLLRLSTLEGWMHPDELV